MLAYSNEIVGPLSCANVLVNLQNAKAGETRHDIPKMAACSNQI